MAIYTSSCTITLKFAMAAGINNSCEFVRCNTKWNAVFVLFFFPRFMDKFEVQTHLIGLSCIISIPCCSKFLHSFSAAPSTTSIYIWSNKIINVHCKCTMLFQRCSHIRATSCWNYEKILDKTKGSNSKKEVSNPSWSEELWLAHLRTLAIKVLTILVSTAATFTLSPLIWFSPSNEVKLKRHSVTLYCKAMEGKGQKQWHVRHINSQTMYLLAS